jgi:ribosomal protein L5
VPKVIKIAINVGAGEAVANKNVIEKFKNKYQQLRDKINDY